MCRLRNIAMHDYQESVTTGQTQADRQTPDKVIPMCRYASQATQKWLLSTLCKFYIIPSYILCIFKEICE